MIHEDLQSLLGAYALDALDEDEVAEVEAHLLECPRCQSEVAAHRNAASVLGTVGREVPAHLWDRIAVELTSDDAAHEPPKVVMLNPIRRKVALPIVAVVAAAAAVAAAVLGVSAARLDHRVNALSSAVSAGGLQQAAAAAVLSPQHQNVQLTSASGHQSATIVTLPDGTAYLIRSDLPTLDSLRTYQLWGLANGQVVSLGLLGSDPQLSAFRIDPGVSRLMISVEPRGGVTQPTTPVLIKGDLPA